ncbi:MAG: nuclear transport factor 2 family protein [Actinomycetota bacterium]
MDPARQALERHVEFWNGQQRDRWVALFSSAMVFEDPVGTPPKVGLAAVHNSWDRSFTPGRRWTLHPQTVISVGQEAAVLMLNSGDLQGRRVEITSLETFTVDADGLIVHIRSFFEQPQDFALADYFTPQRDG